MNNVYKLTSPRNENVFIHLVKGHFVSANNHINYYIGTSDVKHNHDVSVDTAMLLAEYYNTNEIQADTVLCLYETQTLGAYLAHELSRPNMYRYDSKREIYVVGSEYDASGNIIFRDNLVRMIKNKNVIVLISAITSGKTVERAMESVQYYGGNVIGISSVFSAVDTINDIHVNTIFSGREIPAYRAYQSHDCPLCREGTPVMAIVNSYGYSVL